MRRYIVLLLITGIVWSQTDFDTLVLKDGTTYLGEYSKTEEEIVYFKPQNAFTFQPISIKQIQTLELKDGHFIIVRGYAEKIPLAIEGYQKLSTKEKAFYDAAGDAKKWLFYPPTTVLTLAASSGSYFVVTGHHPLESITASIISVFGLVVPYYGFKYLDKNQDVEISPEDIQRYKRIYSEEFKKRKSKNIVKGFRLLGLTTVIIGGLGLLAFMQAMKDFDMGPQPPGPY